jgi:hypothetical protein
VHYFFLTLRQGESALSAAPPFFQSAARDRSNMAFHATLLVFCSSSGETGPDKARSTLYFRATEGSP